MQHVEQNIPLPEKDFSIDERTVQRLWQLEEELERELERDDTLEQAYEKSLEAADTKMQELVAAEQETHREFWEREGTMERRKFLQWYYQQKRKNRAVVYERDLARQKQDFVREVMDSVVQEEEKRPEKEEKFKEVVTKHWGTAKDASGVEAFYEAYLAIWDIPPNEVGRRQVAAKELMNRFAADFDEEECRNMFRALRQQRVRYRDILDDRLFLALNQRPHPIEEMLQEPRMRVGRKRGKQENTEAVVRLRLYVHDATISSGEEDEGATSLQELIARRAKLEIQTAAIDQEEKQEKEQKGKATKEEGKKGQESTTEILRQLIDSKLAHLHKDGQKVVQELLNQGATDLAFIILSAPEMQSVERGVVVYAEGEPVTSVFEGGAVQTYLTARNGEKINIPNGDPFAVGFDAARSEKVELSTNISLLRLSPFLEQAVVRHLSGINVVDGQLMQQREALRLEHFLKIILGKKGTSGEEEAALKELGILHRNGEVNIERAGWFQMYCRFLVGRGELATVRFDDLRKVAREWDMQQKFTLPSLGELRQK